MDAREDEQRREAAPWHGGQEDESVRAGIHFRNAGTRRLRERSFSEEPVKVSERDGSVTLAGRQKVDYEGRRLLIAAVTPEVRPGTQGRDAAKRNQKSGCGTHVAH